MDQTLKVRLCKTMIQLVAVTNTTQEQTEQHLTPHKHRVLALYLNSGCVQEQHESNTDCARPKREERHSSLDRNEV